MFLNVFQRGILMMFWGSREGLEDFCNSSLCCLSHYYLLFCRGDGEKRCYYIRITKEPLSGKYVTSE